MQVKTIDITWALAHGMRESGRVGRHISITAHFHNLFGLQFPAFIRLSLVKYKLTLLQ